MVIGDYRVIITSYKYYFINLKYYTFILCAFVFLKRFILDKYTIKVTYGYFSYL